MQNTPISLIRGTPRSVYYPGKSLVALPTKCVTSVKLAYNPMQQYIDIHQTSWLRTLAINRTFLFGPRL